MRTAQRVLLLLLGVLGGTSWAVGLGELQVESYLGQPFAAELMLVVEPGATPDEMVLAEAGAQDYRRMEVVASGYTFIFDLDAATPAPGGFRVPVRADRAIQDLFIDLVVVLDFRKTRQIRHYPVLLDPPPTDRAVVVTPAPAPRMSTPRPLADAPLADRSLSRPQEPAPARVDAGDGRWTVQSGESLSLIAERVRGERSRRAMSEAIFELNPEAFIAGDRNRLLAGARLRLPTDAVLPSEADAASSAAVARQDDATARERSGVVAGIARDPLVRADEADRVRLRAPPAPEEIDGRLGRWMQEDDDALLAQAGSVRRDIAYARTEVTTIRNQNNNLQERVGLLENRIRSLTRLIELRREDQLASADGADGPAQSGQAPGSEEAAATTAAGRAAASPAPVLSADDDRSPLTVDAPPPTAAASAVDRKFTAARLWPWIILVIALTVGAITILRRVQRRRIARRRAAMDPRLAGLRDWSDPQLLPEDL